MFSFMDFMIVTFSLVEMHSRGNCVASAEQFCVFSKAAHVAMLKMACCLGRLDGGF